MKAYSIYTSIEPKYYNFLIELAKYNNNTLSKTIKILIKKYLHNEFDKNIDFTETSLIKMVHVNRIDSLEEKNIRAKLGEKLHSTFKGYCVDRQISMKKMINKIIRAEYRKYKKSNI